MFKRHKLEQNGDGYNLILYLDLNYVEFAKDLGDDTDKGVLINDAVEDYIKKNIKDIKIKSVKLVLGSIIITTLVLGTPNVYAQTVEVTSPTQIVQTVDQSTYTVQWGDTLWSISQKIGVSISNLKLFNNLANDAIYPGQVLKLKDDRNTITNNEYYTVVAGDTLWLIASRFGTTIDNIKKLNNLTSDNIYPGQKLIVKSNVIQGITYTVKSGDTLWLIAKNHGTTVTAIKSANKLTSDNIYIGQKLFIPTTLATPSPTPVYNWPDVTYIVQPGDTVLGVAKKFGTTTANILKYNYMTPDEWLNANDKIAISGYAPRTYTVTPGEAVAPARVGKIVNWVLEGQYLIKRNDVFTVVDVDTGKQFKAKMLGGYNHSDIETLTAADTAVMKSLFATWQWNPRAVVVFIDGMNIAASVSGMPHSVDTITTNNVTGHFDLYLLNSSPHSSADSGYVSAHQSMVLKAGGR